MLFGRFTRRKSPARRTRRWLLASHPAPPGPPRAPLRVPDIPLTLDGWLHAPPARVAPAALGPLPSRRRVAVVDDEPLVLDLVLEILATENYEVTPASSGPELLDKLAWAGPPDLLITDYVMPGMHGRELAAAVRARVPHLRVLYQTGYVGELFDDRVELEDGAAFVEKPITARGLREAARLALFGAIHPV